jgi:hypothetical protein
MEPDAVRDAKRFSERLQLASQWSLPYHVKANVGTRRAVLQRGEAAQGEVDTLAPDQRAEQADVDARPQLVGHYRGRGLHLLHVDEVVDDV